MPILLIDNYDSFTHILADYLAEISNKEIVIRKNDQIKLDEAISIAPSHIVISPGPGTVTNPDDFGINQEILEYFHKTTPILGVCLGHQGIIHYFGGNITHAPKVMHGKTSKIQILDHNGLFKKLPEEITVMRYHSLIGDNLPNTLIKTAKTDDNIIMAIRHKKYPVYGIQFHPESFQTEYGKEILLNFIKTTCI